MLIIPVSIAMLQFTKELGGLKQKPSLYHFLWFLWVKFWEGLSQAVYASRAIMFVVR